MSAQITTVPLLTCARCSRTTSQAAPLSWRLLGARLPDGSPLGICGPCGIGQMEVDPDGEPGTSCGHSCKGDYASITGTYYVAEPSVGRFTEVEPYSCWDLACVEDFADTDAEVECEHCGQDIGWTVWRYVDGKRDKRVDK